MRIFEDTENRTETGQKTGQRAETRLPKSHQDFWRTRLKRRTYLDPIKGRVEVPEWQVRMFHQGREGWFNLQTANQGIAAIKAKDIYLSLKSQGWEATLAKFKPSEQPKAASCSIGDFVAALEEKAGFRPRTLTIYLTKFRKLVSDLAGIEKGLKAAAKKGKFDYVNGRRAEWLGKIHRQPIGLLTPDSINAWRVEYVARAGANPLKRKSAERSASSILRAGRALFAKDVLTVLGLPIAQSPFEGVKTRTLVRSAITRKSIPRGCSPAQRRS